jgi:formiminotetrahydrofolate cyclodeaminase
MTTKLTLTVEKTVIEKAKSYAKQTGRSLSELIEKYLESITSNEKNDNELSPKLRKIVGAVKLPKNFDEEEELREYYEKKHL